MTCDALTDSMPLPAKSRRSNAVVSTHLTFVWAMSPPEMVGGTTSCSSTK